MKKILLFIVFFSFFALIIPETFLFADTSLGGRFDTGLDLFTFLPFASSAENNLTILPVLPLLDLGLYGQFSTGLLNVGLGIRGFSLLFINVFLPSIYAVLNLWRFTLSAQLGGGALYLLPTYLITGPYFVPELSLWFNFSTFGKANKLQFGLGAMTLLTPQNIQTIKEELFHNFTKNVVFYLAFKTAFNSPWVTWKKENGSRK